MSAGTVDAVWHEYRRDWLRIESEVIEEAVISIYVNGQEMASIMSTPHEQDYLALGFLANEGFIQDSAEVEILHVSDPGCCVDIWLNHPVSMPPRAYITSGCGGGITFDDPSLALTPVEDDLRIEPKALFEIFNQLHTPNSLHARVRGVHASGLSDGERLLIAAEDVGRHNAIDKLRGGCMLEGINTRGRLLLATGRVSSEMLRKGVKMGCPIIASRNSPTSISIAMAEAFNVTLVGYVRRGSMRVYTYPHRLGFEQRVSRSEAHT